MTVRNKIRNLTKKCVALLLRTFAVCKRYVITATAFVKAKVIQLITPVIRPVKKYVDKAVLKCIALVLYVCTFTLWPLFGKGSFYKFLAVAVIVHWVTCLWKIPVKYQVFDRKISFCGFLAALNNLYDELFGDPTVIGVNEYVVVIVILLILTSGKQNWRDNPKVQ